MIDQDDALCESIRTARTMKGEGFATEAEYEAFRRQTRAALKGSHIEFMRLISPQPMKEPSVNEDLFDLNTPAAKEQ